MPEITVGCYVDTPFWGEAVVCLIEPHIHHIGPWIQTFGIRNCGCESDACKDASYCMVRYRAIRPDGVEIWVANGLLTNEISFLRAPDELSMTLASIPRGQAYCHSKGTNYLDSCEFVPYLGS